MTFQQITISSPFAVAKYLDEEMPGKFPTRVIYSNENSYSAVYYPGGDCLVPFGKSPEELIECLTRQIKESDPLEKIRTQAEALGYGLLKLPAD